MIKYFVMQSNERLFRATVVYIGCMLGFVTVVANWRQPLLRLDTHVANDVVLLVALLLPFMGFCSLVSQLTGWRQWLLSLVMFPVIVPSILLALFVSLDTVDTARTGRDLGFNPIQRIEVPDGSEIVMYRTDCGAPCSFGIVVRHEERIVGSLRVVQDVWDAYPADSASVRVVDSRHFEANGQLVPLRPSIVF